jgi:hypothetical protein
MFSYMYKRVGFFVPVVGHETEKYAVIVYEGFE